MSLFDVFIDGVTWTGDTSVTGLSITKSMNERTTAHLRSIQQMPFVGDEVYIMDRDGVTIQFGGIVLKRSASAQRSIRRNEFFIDLECVDWSYFAEVGTPINRTVAGGTTWNTVLGWIVSDSLATYGIAVHPAQIGLSFVPTGGFVWDNVRPIDALRFMVEQLSAGGTSWFLEWSTVTGTKYLRVIQVGTIAAPASITDAVPNCSAITWSDADEPVSNKVLLWCGPEGIGEPIAYSWTGNGVTTSFQLGGVAVPASAVPPSVIVVNGVQLPLWLVGTGPANNIQFDYALNGGTVLFTGSSGPVPVGQVITLTYSPQFPFLVTATASVTPELVAVEFSPETIDYAAAQALVNARLLALNQAPRTMHALGARTAGSGFGHELAWAIGQALTVNIPSMNLVGSFIITGLTTTIEPQTPIDQLVRSDITAVETTIIPKTNVEQWQQLGVGAGA